MHIATGYYNNVESLLILAVLDVIRREMQPNSASK